MRTSNKILLGVFVTILLILSSIHIALYAKYKSGDYVTMQSVEDDRYEKHKIDAIRQVILYGLENVEVIPADQYKLEIEKHPSNFIHFSVNGDSLVIHGDSLVKEQGREDQKWRSNEQVRIYTSADLRIVAIHSDIELHPGKDSMSAKSYDVELRNDSKLHLTGNDYNDSSLRYIRNLLIDAHSSEISLAHFTHLDQVKIVLRASKFDDDDSFIKYFMPDADAKSVLTLHGNQIPQRSNTGQ